MCLQKVEVGYAKYGDERFEAGGTGERDVWMKNSEVDKAPKEL